MKKIARKSKVQKNVAVAASIVLVVLVAVILFAVPKLRGDGEIMDDINRHFEQLDSYTPTPDDYRGIEQEDSFAPSSPTRGEGSFETRGGPSQKVVKENRTQQRTNSKSRRKKSKKRHSISKSTGRWSGIREVASGTYLIDEGLMAEVQKNPMKFIGKAQAVIAERRGEPAGFKLNRIGKTSPLHVIGLRNGDVVRAVNGYELKSVDEVLLAVAALRFAKKYRVDILRNSQRRSFYYRVE